VQSNTAAFLNATPALWIAWLGTLGPNGRPLTGTQQIGVLVGLTGVLMILSPRGGFHAAGLGWQLLILLGCLSWSLGTHYHRNAGAANPPLMFVALQMLAGGVILLIISAATGEWGEVRWSEVAPNAWWSVLWLVGPGSILAFVAYGYALMHLPVSVVSTYAFVNPVIAVFLGSALLGETFTLREALGTLLVVASVALTLYRRKPRPAKPSRPLKAYRQPALILCKRRGKRRTSSTRPSKRYTRTSAR